MTERDYILPFEEVLAICLLGELRKSGSCNTVMLKEVFPHLNEGSTLKDNLERAIHDSRLPDKDKSELLAGPNSAVGKSDPSDSSDRRGNANDNGRGNPA